VEGAEPVALYADAGKLSCGCVRDGTIIDNDDCSERDEAKNKK